MGGGESLSRSPATGTRTVRTGWRYSRQTRHAMAFRGRRALGRPLMPGYHVSDEAGQSQSEVRSVPENTLCFLSTFPPFTTTMPSSK